MAGDWIKTEENLPDKPEVYAIAQALGIDPDAVVGKLLRVWVWAGRNCSASGNAPVTALPAIDRCAGLSGFAIAMSSAGWLEIGADTIVFPNFDRHTSQTAKDRCDATRRVQKHRGKCNAESVTPVTEKCYNGNGSSVTKPLPEKRREEYINTPLPPTPEQGPTPAAVKREAGRQLPESLNTEAFRAAWGNWLEYSHEKNGYKPLPSQTLDKHLMALAGMGPILAVQAIDNAIARNWREPILPNAGRPAQPEVRTPHITSIN